MREVEQCIILHARRVGAAAPARPYGGSATRGSPLLFILNYLTFLVTMLMGCNHVYDAILRFTLKISLALNSNHI